MNRVGFDSSVFRHTMETQQTESKFLYGSLNELIGEWQDSDKDCSLWEYLDMPEQVFKSWISKCKRGVFDN